MATVSGSPSISRQQRNPDQHASPSTQSIHVSMSKKTRKKKISGPQSTASAPVSSSLNTPRADFDAKSILPDSKSRKSISKLLESSKQHSRSQTYTYECIDGSIREFNKQTSSYTVHEEPKHTIASTQMFKPSSSKQAPKPSSSVAQIPEPSSSSKPAPKPSSSSTQMPKPSSSLIHAPTSSSSPTLAPKASTSSARAPEGPVASPTAGEGVHAREQFKAYGIEAFPTRAVLNQMCYDFVSTKRWCPNGRHCPRIHPLDKRKYLADVIHESVLLSRMKNGHNRSNTLPYSSIEPQHSNTLLPLQSTTTQYSHPTTRVEFPLPASTMSTTISSPSSNGGSKFHDASGDVSQGKSKSSDNEHRKDGEIKKTPWGDRAPSDTSSEGGQYSDVNFWGPVPTSASDWEDPPENPPAHTASSIKNSSFNLTRSNTTVTPSENSQARKRHPRPNTNQVCHRWLRDQCNLGYACKYIHHTLDYDDPEPVPEPVPVPVRRPPETFHSTIHNHMRLRFGPGLEVQEFKTGFESQWILISNLPLNISDNKIREVLRAFGEIVEIRRPVSNNSNSTVFRIQFAKPADAYKAFTTLHGSLAFSRKLEVRMGVETREGGTIIKDTVVRLDWDAPTRTVYMGYASEEKANEAVAMARRRPYQNYWTTGCIHIGMPAVGLVTVKFDHLPFDVTEEGMEIFGPHQGMVTASPNYKDCTLEESISGVRRLLSQYNGKIQDVDIRPPPYREGKMRAWVYFNTAADAKQAAENLHGRKPIFMGFTRLSARHIKTLNFSLATLKYQKVASAIKEFSDDIFRQGAGYSLNVVPRETYYTLRLCGEDMKTLSRLKAELERTINGETLTEGDKVAWDDFFGRPSGISYLLGLERRHPGVMIEKDISRRVVRLYGPMSARAQVRDEILWRINSLRSQKVHIIPFDGRLGISLLEGGFRDLQAQFGQDNVMLDLWSRIMRIQGDTKLYDLAMDLLNKVRSSQKFVERIIPGRECPVCFEDPVLPVRLPCGHSWCKACLQRYLQASIEHKFFPLTCLGKEAKCTARIPLFTIREMLDAAEMQAITDAAFTHHIQSHSDEFHFCPTPDCDQVYRTTSSGVFIQCPSCLVRICPNCHADAHDGLTCNEFKHGDDLFRDWAEKNNVKRCPGCKIAIEKDEGCNHMMCTMCKTHICWVCMKTFPNGDGIYGHMRAEHGGFGLMDPF